MSSLVDERIVEFGFNNKNFEYNVKNSMNTIDKLKSSLNFSGVSSSLNKNLNSVDTSVITKGLEKASNSFSAMEVVAIAAIANITNRVIDLGIKMVKSLSVDNISAGWEKYAQKTTSVATLISQGYDMDTVNRSLEKLNWFTDETSYGFTDMVDNISKFTAAGQNLEDSVQAMMGIANWAALSGQNAGVASRSMYQLSQAMGAGIIRLQDWKSIQNANMDTQEFRKTALETAVAMGQLQETVDGTYITLTGKNFDINKFTTELDEGWFTSDVLMKTLEKYSSAVDTLYEKVESDDSISTTSEAIDKYGDELDEFGLKAFRAAQEARTLSDALNSVKDAVGSAWLTTFESIFGGYDTAKVLWTDLANELYDVFVEGANTRNEILSVWNDLGGRDDLFANTEETTGAFWNLYYAVIEVQKLVSGAWKSIFGFSDLEDGEERINDIGNKLKGFTERLREISENLYLSDEAAESFSNILKGLFSILKAVTKVIGALWTGVQPVLKVAKTLISGIVHLLGIAGKGFSDFVSTTTIFQRAGEGLANFFDKLINTFKGFNILTSVKNLLSNLTNIFKQSGGTTENYSRILNGLKAILEILQRVLYGLYQISIKYLIPTLGTLFSFLLKMGASLGGVFIRLLAWIGDLLVKFNEFTKTNVIFQKVVTSISDGFKRLFDVIRGAFSEFGNVDSSGVDKFNDEVTTKFSPLRDLIEGLGKLFSGLWSVLKAVAPVIGQLFGYIGKTLGYLGEKLSLIFSGDSSLFSIDKLVDVAFWTAILISVYKVLDIFTSIREALVNVIGGFGDVLDSKAMMNYAEALKTLSIGLLILVVALILLASIDEKKLASSLASMAVLVGLLMTMMKVMSGMFLVTKGLGIKSFMAAKSMESAAIGMLTMAAAVGLLALSVKLIGSMDQKQMVNGVMGITLIISMLLGAATIIGKNSKLFNRGAKGLIKMALAVLIMTVPLKTIGNMDPDKMQQGLLGITALVGLATLFSYISGKIKKSTKAATGLIGFAVALTVLMVPLKIIGGMGWSKLAIGMTGIIGLAGIMVGLGLLSKYMKKSLITSLAMVQIANALLIASLPVRIIGNMGWDKLAIGMVGIAGIASVMAGFGLLSKHMNKSIKTALAMNLMGLALIQFAIALKILGSMPWDNLARAGVALLGITTLMLIISKIFKGTSIFNITGFGVSLIVLSAGLIALSIAIATLSLLKPEALGKALLVLVVTFALLGIAGYILTPVVPIILALSAALLLFGAAALMVALAITLITTTFGLFAGVMATVLIKIADAIIVAAPKIAAAMGALVKAILDALIIAVPSLVQLLNEIIVGVIQLLTNRGPEIIDTVIMLLDHLLVSLADHMPSITASLVSMLITLLSVLRDNTATIIDIVMDIIINLLNAIKNRVPEIIKTLGEVVIQIVESIVKTVTSLVPRLVAAAFDLFIGLIDGLGQAIEDNAGKIREVMIRFAEHMWKAFLNFWGIKSPSRKMIEAGKDLIAGLIKGLTDSAGKALSSIVDIGKKVINKLGEGFKNAWKSTTTWLTNTAGSIGGFFSKQVNSLKSIGSNLITGLGDGLKNTWNSVSNTLDDLGKGITNGFKKLFGIKSPSRVFAEIGKFIDLGLIQGINRYSSSVYDSTESMGEEAIDGFANSGISGAIKKIIDFLNNEMDGEIVITPVLDLSEIQNGKNQLYSMMKGFDGYSVDGSNDTVRKTYNSIKSSDRNADSLKRHSDNDLAINGKDTTINNTFNIRGSNPKEIAEEVGKVIQKQVDRRNAKWAR